MIERGRNSTKIRPPSANFQYEFIVRNRAPSHVSEGAKFGHVQSKCRSRFFEIFLRALVRGTKFPGNHLFWLIAVAFSWYNDASYPPMV